MGESRKTHLGRCLYVQSEREELGVSRRGGARRSVGAGKLMCVGCSGKPPPGGEEECPVHREVSTLWCQGTVSPPLFVGRTHMGPGIVVGPGLPRLRRQTHDLEHKAP